MSAPNLEIGTTIKVGSIDTNIHDVGEGEPVVLIHGSGPGVTAWANWRLVIPELARTRRVVAPDMVGFGYTDRPEGVSYCLDTWVDHLVGILDALELERVDIIGNSFGGALALALATRFPDRIKRMVLMGSVGTSFTLTEGLDAVWGYTPSIANMRRVLGYFAYDEKLVNDDLVELRYRASVQPQVQEAFSAMFPEPRQRWLEALASDEELIKAIRQPTLIVHGRDDRVIPFQSSIRLHELIVDSQLHVFGKCGHWTQIEQAGRFIDLVSSFLIEHYH